MRRCLLPKADREGFPRSTNQKGTNVYTQLLDNEIDAVGLLLSKAAGF
jgi:hypothetical protein